MFFPAPRPRRRATLGILLAAALVAGACSSGDPAQDPSGANATDPATEPDEEPEAPAESTDAGEPLVVDVDLQERNFEGMTFRVHRLEVDGDAIAADVEIVVPADLGILWLNNAEEPAFARDDLGNEYPLVPPTDNEALRFGDGEQLEGRLQWQGPLADDASTLTLLFNESRDPEGGTVNDRVRPHFTLGPIDLSGAGGGSSGQGVDPVEIDLDIEERTASGAVLRVHRLAVTELAVEVDVEIIAPAGDTLRMSSSTGGGVAVVRDDSGNDYPLLPPDDNVTLKVDGGEHLDGTLVFQGPLVDGATTLTLLFNERSDPEGNSVTDRTAPHFTVGPIPLDQDGS
jgi:hypothetical protein